jgi:DNA repair ATPase RecN
MPVTIRARNFQSIASAEVEVDRFTVVTGTNNSGKSALQRAIRGVFQNTGGTAFIREGETTCSVEVDFGKDGKVWWEKGTGKRDRPTYVINDGEPLYPGASVPDEVAAFGIVPIQAGGQEVWPTIAPQFSGQIFLLDKPGSALAEAVADVERVGQLNRALRSSESDRRQAAATLKVRQIDLVKQEATVESFDGLDEAVEAVDALEERRTKVVTVGRAVVRLAELRDQLQEALESSKKLAPVADITLPDPGEVKRLKRELIELRDLQARLAAAKAEEAKYKGINEVLVEVDEEPSKRVLAALNVLVELRTRLNKAESAVVVQQEGLEQAEAEQAEAEQAEAEQAEAEQAEAELTELGQCPTCGAEMRLKVVKG